MSAQAAVDRTVARQREVASIVQLVQLEMAAWLYRLDPGDLMGSWLRDVLPGVYTSLVNGQQRAAAGATGFVSEASTAMGLDASTAYEVVPAAFGGAAADGRPLTTMLSTPPLRARLAMEHRGQSADWALGQIRQSVLLMGASEVADAGRGADMAAMAATPRVKGYVRVVGAGACSRCAILAGRWYRYNASFKRHKRCQCTGVPAGEARASRGGGWRTDPQAYFRSLSPRDQDRLFGRAGAEAIRAGADIASVVNARRGLHTVDFGRHGTVLATREGTTRRGYYGRLRRRLEEIEGRKLGRLRLTPEAILRLAHSREELIRLLARNGYLNLTAAEVAAL
ncbi:hypothetical protein AB0A77_28335 [Streptomyces varsoviensis]|uniref:VG15 protein n=1 Tax=Streptomyces varsoviensis TaxID=67373 RepID=UPI0033D3D7E4